MRYYFYASGGLLVAAVVVSLLLDNWTVLTGVAIGLALFLLGLVIETWLDDKSAAYDEETQRHRDALIGPKPWQTTYYYDVDDGAELPNDDASRPS